MRKKNYSILIKYKFFNVAFDAWKCYVTENTLVRSSNFDHNLHSCGEFSSLSFYSFCRRSMFCSLFLAILIEHFVSIALIVDSRDYNHLIYLKKVFLNNSLSIRPAPPFLGTWNIFYIKIIRLKMSKQFRCSLYSWSIFPGNFTTFFFDLRFMLTRSNICPLRVVLVDVLYKKFSCSEMPRSQNLYGQKSQNSQ